MKRKTASLFGLFSMALSGFIYANLTMGTASVPQQLSLNSIEVLSHCEVSPNASLNIGYCSENVGSDEGSCTKTGDPASVRCSVNF